MLATAALLVPLLALEAAWLPAAAEDRAPARTVTVSATAQIAVEPDMARISTGVTTEAETAKEALAQNSAVMTRLVAGLKESGIEAADIQTTSFDVAPRYTNPRDGQAPVIDGYRVTNQVQVTARDLDRLGEVLDKLVSLGANQVSGLSFEASKAITLTDEARADAVKIALRRAKIIAAAAGAEVGEVISMAEDAPQFVPMAAPMARAMKAEAVPIERGTEMLEARVTVTWALK
jgi:hypothetical protein